MTRSSPPTSASIPMPTPPPAVGPTRAPTVALFIAAATSLVAFHLIGSVYLNNFSLDLGSLNYPTPRYLAFVAFWTLFGGLSAIAARTRLSPVLGGSRRLERVGSGVERAAGAPLPVRGRSAAAFAIPLADTLRAYCTGRRSPTTRARTGLPPSFSQADGCGSPSPDAEALLRSELHDQRRPPVSGVFPGLARPARARRVDRRAGIVNPLLSALTVPPLFRRWSHLVGPVVGAGRRSALPVGAVPSDRRRHAALAHVLPDGADLVPVDVPAHHTRRRLVTAITPASRSVSRSRSASVRSRRCRSDCRSFVSWAWRSGVWTAQPDARRCSRSCFPALSLAALFLARCGRRTDRPGGSDTRATASTWWRTTSAFTTFAAHDLTAVAGFDFSQVGPAIARTALGMFRLNSDLFGWPSSFALLLLALPALASGPACSG